MRGSQLCQTGGPVRAVSGYDRHTEGPYLQGQIEMCRQYVAEHGYEMVSELAEDDRGEPTPARMRGTS